MKQYASVLAFLENLRTALWNWTLRLLPPATPWWALWRGMKVVSMHFFCIKPNCKIDKSYFVLPPRWLECGWQVLRDKCFSDPFCEPKLLVNGDKALQNLSFPLFYPLVFLHWDRLPSKISWTELASVLPDIKNYSCY